jgi:hypothetical protein
MFVIVDVMSQVLQLFGLHLFATFLIAAVDSRSRTVLQRKVQAPIRHPTRSANVAHLRLTRAPCAQIFYTQQLPCQPTRSTPPTPRSPSCKRTSSASSSSRSGTRLSGRCTRRRRRASGRLRRLTWRCDRAPTRPTAAPRARAARPGRSSMGSLRALALLLLPARARGRARVGQRACQRAHLLAQRSKANSSHAHRLSPHPLAAAAPFAAPTAATGFGRFRSCHKLRAARARLACARAPATSGCSHWPPALTRDRRARTCHRSTT